MCARCGEGINFDRFEQHEAEVLCLACAHPEQIYYQPLPASDAADKQ